jgi:hypothetical protein
MWCCWPRPTAITPSGPRSIALPGLGGARPLRPLLVALELRPPRRLGPRLRGVGLVAFVDPCPPKRLAAALASLPGAQARALIHLHPHQLLPEHVGHSTVRNRPRLGFIGSVIAYKPDLDLLQRLPYHRSDCQLVPIGRVGEGGSQHGSAWFRSGSPALPDYCQYALPALADFGHLADLCADASAILAAVDALLAPPPRGRESGPRFPWRNCRHGAATVAQLMPCWRN